ncbi:hypothetical protein [Psychroflexus tropicus]|uniref:hypothetical protein n=1 Tax=Psychroflexus tropicus TaxID=197345 RepID=UPI00035EF7AB|nr:hypothetical protein [Psychroflexus tropicus]
MNRWLAILLFTITLASCQDFDLKKQSANEILEQEIKSINWNEVDFYPTFTTCGIITSKQESKSCFENQIKKTIRDRLEKVELITSVQTKDTLIVKLFISSNGDTRIDGFKIQDELRDKNPEIKNWLREAISELPEIFPAQKRSIPVSLHAQIPILIK